MPTSPPPSTTLPIGQRYADQPEGEIRDESLRPWHLWLADKISGAMGFPEAGAPRERYIAPTIGAALMAHGAGTALGTKLKPLAEDAKLGAQSIYRGAVHARDPLYPEAATSMAWERPPPSPHPVVERFARRFVDPDDEKLYQLFLEKNRKMNAEWTEGASGKPIDFMTHPRTVYGNSLSDVGQARNDIRDVQAYGRWQDMKANATPSTVEGLSNPAFHEYEPGSIQGFQEFTSRHPFQKGWNPPDSPQLTAMDHAFQAMKDYHRGTPLSSQALRVLAYNAAKGVAQGTQKVAPPLAPEVERWLLRRIGKASDMGSKAGELLQATPPSLKSMLWGLRPLWARD